MAALAVAGTAFVALAMVLPLVLMVGTLAGARAAVPAEVAARAVAAVVPAVEPDALPPVLAATARELGGTVSVVLADGTVVGDVVAPDGAVAQVRDATRAVNLEEGDRRRSLVPVVTDAGVAVVDVRVAVDRGAVATARLAVVLLGAMLVLLGTLLVLRLAGPTVRASAALTAAATRVADGDLAPAPAPAGPEDIAVVGTALAALTARVRALDAGDRGRAAALAGDLVSPLAALRADASSLTRSSVRARLLAGVDTVERRVHAAAGTTGAVAAGDHEPAASPAPPAAPAPSTRGPRGEGSVAAAAATGTVTRTPPRDDLTVIVRDRCAAWAEPLAAAGASLDVSLPGISLLTPLTGADGAMLLDVLLDNALRHTRPGVAVTVRLVPGSSGGGAALEVADDGPGFTADLEGTTGVASGGGAGLATARSVLERAGGRMELGRRPGGGAAVRCLLPAVH